MKKAAARFLCAAAPLFSQHSWPGHYPIKPARSSRTDERMYLD